MSRERAAARKVAAESRLVEAIGWGMMAWSYGGGSGMVAWQYGGGGGAQAEAHLRAQAAAAEVVRAQDAQRLVAVEAAKLAAWLERARQWQVEAEAEALVASAILREAECGRRLVAVAWWCGRWRQAAVA